MTKPEASLPGLRTSDPQRMLAYANAAYALYRTLHSLNAKEPHESAMERPGADQDPTPVRAADEAGGPVGAGDRDPAAYLADLRLSLEGWQGTAGEATGYRVDPGGLEQLARRVDVLDGAVNDDIVDLRAALNAVISRLDGLEFRVRGLEPPGSAAADAASKQNTCAHDWIAVTRSSDSNRLPCFGGRQMGIVQLCHRCGALRVGWRSEGGVFDWEVPREVADGR